MLRLYVMRHAKSSWAVPGARDFDRELNDRGNSDLENVSSEIAKLGYVPDQILCSPAKRTMQTLEGIKGALKPAPNVIYHEQLYSGGLDDYITLVRQVEGNGSIMTIGHNPMSGALAASMAGDGDPKLLSEINLKYPTAAIAVLDFDLDDWSQIEKYKAVLVDCIIPSKLR